MSMSRDIRRSYSLADDYMKAIYDDIKQNPITLVDDEIAKLKYVEKEKMTIGWRAPWPMG